MPQALVDGDFLSVLLGDAKKDISGIMVREADSYLHGGVDMDCHHLQDHDDHHDHCEEHEEGRHGHEPKSFDPWRWINVHIRAPEIDRHIDDNKMVELMPWFWAATQSNPHNIEAWRSAWYVALFLMKDEPLALRIASEGWRLNPSAIEMAYVLGRTYCAEKTRDSEKSELMFLEVVRIAERKGQMENNDNLYFFSAAEHLSESAGSRKDAQALTALLNVARRINPNHPMTLSIAQKLKDVESGGTGR